MQNRNTHSIERHCDVVVIGGSAAGLAGALQVLRQRRSVIVVDAGEPRNAPAAHMHGFLGRDGTPPSALVADGRAEVRSYGGEVLDGRVVDCARRDDGRFRVELVGGHAVVARRVLVTTGIVDELPEVEGLREQWGRGVIHCPFCHGYEFADQRIVQIVTHPMGLHPTTLFRHLTAELTLVVDPAAGIEDSTLEPFRAGGVTVLTTTARRIVTDAGDQVIGVDLVDGQRLDADVVVVGPKFDPRVESLASLGLAPVAHPSGLGDVLDADETGMTSVPGVYAAGNVTDPSQQVLPAAAHGSKVGAMISFDLAGEDLRAAMRPSANEEDWDRRYSGDKIWSGNPNGSLVKEASELPVGRALDIGAGEGGDAIWLAEQGWTVTASDISTAALQRVGAEAERRGLDVERWHADGNARGAFGDGGFDLVTAFYASVPRTPDDRFVDNLLRAVAPGGRLVAVSHDIEPMRHPIDTTVTSRVFDPDAYVRVEDIVAVLDASSDWEIEVNDLRPRPAGAASSSHHVDDVVLRARRRAD